MERSALTLPHVVILGAGPAGCGAAWQLRRLDHARVTVVERQDQVGGNAASFEWAGQRLDFGSHRLHYTTEPAILDDIRRLLGDELLPRRRNGRIRLRGRYVRFPFKPADLLLSLDKGFAAGVLRDMAAGKFGLARRPTGDSFADELMRRLGPTICESFYFPYARKIWGRDPGELSGIQARRRVTANSFGKLVRRILKPVGDGMFYYPRQGFGQITEGFAAGARDLGAEFLLNSGVERLDPPTAPGSRWRVHVRETGIVRTIEADHVWSTIPITLLARLTTGAPAGLSAAHAGMDYRAMVLVYLQMPVHQFTTTDAHYFPETAIAMTRLSEPKNYAGLAEPRGSTVLCAELPCSEGDPVWSMDDRALGDLVARDIRAAGLPLERTPAGVQVRRLRHAYPIYLNGYERPFDALDQWAGSIPGLLTFGRQGLFAHDNTHHALYMAYCAADCLRGGVFDQARWSAYRQVFATHVVED